MGPCHFSTKRGHNHLGPGRSKNKGKENKNEGPLFPAPPCRCPLLNRQSNLERYKHMIRVMLLILHFSCGLSTCASGNPSVWNFHIKGMNEVRQPILTNKYFLISWKWHLMKYSITESSCNFALNHWWVQVSLADRTSYWFRLYGKELELTLLLMFQCKIMVSVKNMSLKELKLFYLVVLF